MNKQNGKGPRDMENKLMVTKWVGNGNNIFLNEINLFSHLYVMISVQQ